MGKRVKVLYLCITFLITYSCKKFISPTEKDTVNTSPLSAQESLVAAHDTKIIVYENGSYLKNDTTTGTDTKILSNFDKMDFVQFHLLPYDETKTDPSLEPYLQSIDDQKWYVVGENLPTHQGLGIINPIRGAVSFFKDFRIGNAFRSLGGKLRSLKISVKSQPVGIKTSKTEHATIHTTTRRVSGSDVSITGTPAASIDLAGTETEKLLRKLNVNEDASPEEFARAFDRELKAVQKHQEDHFQQLSDKDAIDASKSQDFVTAFNRSAVQSPLFYTKTGEFADAEIAAGGVFKRTATHSDIRNFGAISITTKEQLVESIPKDLTDRLESAYRAETMLSTFRNTRQELQEGLRQGMLKGWDVEKQSNFIKDIENFQKQAKAKNLDRDQEFEYVIGLLFDKYFKKSTDPTDILFELEVFKASHTNSLFFGQIQEIMHFNPLLEKSIPIQENLTRLLEDTSMVSDAELLALEIKYSSSSAVGERFISSMVDSAIKERKKISNRPIHTLEESKVIRDLNSPDDF